MADPFVGEIKMVGFSFAPRGWATCDGQILSISQNTALFSLFGTFYGGNGTSNFALPDLRGRVPIHQGQGNGLSPYSLGEQTGVESVTITNATMAAHNHSLGCDTLGGKKSTPVNNVAAEDGLAGAKPFAATSDGSTFNGQALALDTTDGGLPHENRMPLLVNLFIVALQGVYPARN